MFQPLFRSGSKQTHQVPKPPIVDIALAGQQPGLGHEAFTTHTFLESREQLAIERLDLFRLVQRHHLEIVAQSLGQLAVEQRL